MKKWALPLVALTLAIIWMGPLRASSHREAPLISEDPVADNTDVYAFVSPDATSTVTIIANSAIKSSFSGLLMDNIPVTVTATGSGATASTHALNITVVVQ